MSEDARFEDGGDRPLNLGAQEVDDLKVMAALLQDAIFTPADLVWQAKQRKFALLVNRFRWEVNAKKPERVRSVLAIEDVLHVASQGFDRRSGDLVLSILDLVFHPSEDGMGRVEFILAGDGGLALEVEALELNLRDVTRPYLAPSGHRPDHGLDD